MGKEQEERASRKANGGGESNPTGNRSNSKPSSSPPNKNTNRSTNYRASSNKFVGNCADLGGHIFDCSDYRQADKYNTTVRRIVEYVGSE